MQVGEWVERLSYLDKSRFANLPFDDMEIYGWELQTARPHFLKDLLRIFGLVK